MEAEKFMSPQRKESGPGARHRGAGRRGRGRDGVGAAAAGAVAAWTSGVQRGRGPHGSKLKRSGKPSRKYRGNQG